MHSPSSPPVVSPPSTRRRCARLSHRERRLASDHSSRTLCCCLSRPSHQHGTALRTRGVGPTRRMLGVIELRHLAPVAAVAVKVGRQVCGGQHGAALRTGGAAGAGLSQRGAAGVVELAAIAATHPAVSDVHAGAIE